MTIKRRLMALENAHGGLSRFIVAIGPEEFDYDNYLSSRGIVRTAKDMMVIVRKPAGAPVSIRVDGRLL